MLRRVLDGLYDSAAGLAALFLVLLLLSVLTSILGRTLHFMIPGTDAYAGYFMAASAFLALAHTLRRGEHIRVSLIVSQLPAGLQHRTAILASGLGLLLGGLLAVFSIRLVIQSIAYNDISTSNDATPLWIPQLSMAIGTIIFFIALVDDCIEVVVNRKVNADTLSRHE